MRVRLISGISHRFPWLSQSEGQVAHVLLTRSPLIRPASWSSPFDLHVLSTPPAFVLSQDQTLRKCLLSTPEEANNHTKRTRRSIIMATNRKHDVFNSYQIRSLNTNTQHTPKVHTMRPCRTIGINYQAHC